MVRFRRRSSRWEATPPARLVLVVLLTLGAAIAAGSPVSAAPVTIETTGTCFAWGTGSVKVWPQVVWTDPDFTYEWELITGEVFDGALVIQHSRTSALAIEAYPSLQIDFYSTTDCSSNVTFSPRTASLCVTHSGTNDFNVNQWGNSGAFVDPLTPSTIWDLTEGRPAGTTAVFWLAGVRYVAGYALGPTAGTMVLSNLPTSIIDVDATFINNNGIYTPSPYGYFLSQAYQDTGIDYVTPLCSVGGAPTGGGGGRNPIDLDHYLMTSDLPNTR